MGTAGVLVLANYAAVACVQPTSACVTTTTAYNRYVQLWGFVLFCREIWDGMVVFASSFLFTWVKGQAPLPSLPISVRLLHVAGSRKTCLRQLCDVLGLMLFPAASALPRHGNPHGDGDGLLKRGPRPGRLRLLWSGSTFHVYLVQVRPLCASFPS